MINRRLYMDLLEYQWTSQVAPQLMDTTSSYQLQLENEHASEGWHMMREPQTQRWPGGQSFASQFYIPTPPRTHYDPQTSAGIVPSSLSIVDPVLPHGNTNFYSEFPANGFAYPALGESGPFNIASRNNLDSDSLTRDSSRYPEDHQGTSDSGSDQRDPGRQHLQRREPSPAQQQQENRNRPKSIACVRCHRQRIKVRELLVSDTTYLLVNQCISDDDNPPGPCKACKSIVNQSIYRLPCLRLKVGDIVFYREGNSPDLAWSLRWNNMTMSNVTKWKSPEVKFIQVSHGLCPDTLKLEVRKFVPQEGDVLERKWVHGEVRKTKSVEPYAIENMKRAAQEVKRYISANVRPCLTDFLDTRDKVVRDAYMLAYKQSTPPVSR
jgi:hypothetical protein